MVLMVLIMRSREDMLPSLPGHMLMFMLILFVNVDVIDRRRFSSMWSLLSMSLNARLHCWVPTLPLPDSAIQCIQCIHPSIPTGVVDWTFPGRRAAALLLAYPGKSSNPCHGPQYWCWSSCSTEREREREREITRDFQGVIIIALGSFPWQTYSGSTVV